jgi:LCP family protein required for cell wall assembly
MGGPHRSERTTEGWHGAGRAHARMTAAPSQPSHPSQPSRPPQGPRHWPIVAAVAGAAVAAVGIAFILLRPGQVATQPGSPTPIPTATLNADLLSNRLTVLLLGLDSSESRRAAHKGMNSDTIMLASISADQSAVTLISVPRDTVDVPLPDGTTWKQKINAIYSVNGAQGAVDAISSLLQVDVDGYITIDMGDLIQLVDAVGGVRVHPHAPLVDAHIDLDMKAGRQVLDGATALDYVRTRVDTDFARAARQQEVILQLVSRLVDQKTDVDVQALLDGLDSFDTDLPRDQMPTLLELARRAQSADVTEQVLDPEDGFMTGAGDFGDGRGYILEPDIDAMRKFAARHLGD